MSEKKLWVLAIAVALLAANAAFAETSIVSSCGGIDVGHPSFGGSPLSLSTLPKVLLVGREAKLLVVDGQSEIQSEQTFLKAESKLLCASSVMSNQQYEINAPVLLDLRTVGGAGSSVWSFRLMVEDSHVGVWNQVSKMQSQSFRLDNLDVDMDVEVFQESHDQYEIVFHKTVGKAVMTLSILYDAVY